MGRRVDESRFILCFCLFEVDKEESVVWIIYFIIPNGFKLANTYNVFEI